MGSEANFVLTTAASHLESSLCNFGNVYVSTRRSFTDGETYVCLTEMPKDHALVIHSGSPDQDMGLGELESVLDALDHEGVKMNLVFTYMPYSRQDKRFQPGEPNKAERILKNLSRCYDTLGTIYSLDTHFAGEEWVSNYNFRDFSARALLKDVVASQYGNVVYAVPDAGAARRTGLPAAGEKTRISDKKVVIKLTGEIKAVIDTGLPVVIEDDMLASGGTLATIAEETRNYNPDAVLIAMATHGVIPYGIERISKVYSNLFLTNSVNIENHANIIDISALIAGLPQPK